jgi:hypothetical protein
LQAFTASSATGSGPEAVHGVIDHIRHGEGSCRVSSISHAVDLSGSQRADWAGPV